MKKHKVELSSLYGKMVTELADIPFMDMDVCCNCGGYDTIQTYVQKENGKWIHVCEKCLKEIFIKYQK